MKIEKISNAVFVALVAIAIVVIGMCFMMTPESLVLSDLVQPAEPNDPNTGLFLGYIYFLLGAAIVITLVTAVMTFIIKLGGNNNKSLIMLGGLGVLLLIMIICYATGDGTPMHIVGYEGDENTEGWLKMCDMFLRTSYILVTIAIIAIIASPFAKKLK